MTSARELFIQLISFNFFKKRAFVCAFLFSFSLPFFLGACTNVGKKLSNLRGINLENDHVTNTSGSTFLLANVLPTQSTNGASYDLIGTGQEFDSYCSGTFVCKCSFQYTSNGGNETLEEDVIYQESNLIRCQNSIPSGVSTFQIWIVSYASTNGVTAATGYVSNTLDVTLSNGSFAGSTAYVDLTNAANYVQSKRFQCRKHEFVANPLDSTVIDPIQSQDPKINYPFNYYSTNDAKSLLEFQNLGDQSWECTLSKSLTPAAVLTYGLQWWANPRVFSYESCLGNSFCASDLEEMYPSDDLVSGYIPSTDTTVNGKTRASFWLLEKPYGVFQTPVKAAIAPSSYTASRLGVIGYAAKPIPNSSGVSSCPSISLPANSRWVKLWNFRATDLTPPKVVTSANLSAQGTIGCYTATQPGIFPSCDNAYYTGIVPAGESSFLALDAVSAGEWAARVFILAGSTSGSGTVAPNACYHPHANNPFNPQTWPNTANTDSDSWIPSHYGFNPVSMPLATMATLPLNLYTFLTASSPGWYDCLGADSIYRLSSNICSGGAVGNVGTGNPAGVGPAAAAPEDASFTTDDFNNGNNYNDQLFIVSDPGINDTAMQNQSSSTYKYLPVTYRSKGDCDNASRAGCTAVNPITWKLNVKEVGSDTGADVYPLCVVQFYK